MENVLKAGGEQNSYKYEMEVGLEASNIGTNESINKN